MPDQNDPIENDRIELHQQVENALLRMGMNPQLAGTTLLFNATGRCRMPRMDFSDPEQRVIAVMLAQQDQLRGTQPTIVIQDDIQDDIVDALRYCLNYHSSYTRTPTGPAFHNPYQPPKESIIMSNTPINAHGNSTILFVTSNNNLIQQARSFVLYADPTYEFTQWGQLWIHVRKCFTAGTALEPHDGEDTRSEEWFVMRAMLEACYQDQACPPSPEALARAFVQTASYAAQEVLPRWMYFATAASCDTDASRSLDRALESRRREVCFALRDRLARTQGLQEFQISTFNDPPGGWFDVDRMPRYLADKKQVLQENEAERSIVESEIDESHRDLVRTYLTRMHQQSLRGLKFYHLSMLTSTIQWAMTRGPQVQYYQYTKDSVQVRGVQYGCEEHEFRDWGFGV